jgi:hypothetical protein
MAVEIGLKLRTATPCGDWRTFVVHAGIGGVTAGCLDKIHDTVGAYVQNADAGEDVAFLYHAEKITCSKDAGSIGFNASAGDKVYYDAANHTITPVADSNLWIGIFVKDCLSTDTEALIDLKGDKAHS